MQPYGTRTVPFAFKPTYPGQFLDELAIENVLDPSNAYAVVVKANVQRPENFWLQKINLDFDVVGSSGRTKSMLICLKNISNRERTFKIRKDLFLFKGTRRTPIASSTAASASAPQVNGVLVHFKLDGVLVAQLSRYGLWSACSGCGLRRSGSAQRGQPEAGGTD